MGAWGSGVFQNDYAMDLVDGLDHDDTGESILEALRVANDSARISSVAAMEAVAAAELVLATAGHPVYELPSEAVTWLAKHASLVADVATLEAAITALDRCTSQDSALYWDWIRAAQRDQFLVSVANLRTSLVTTVHELTVAPQSR